MRVMVLVLLSQFALVSGASANPGAWVMSQGKGQVISNFTYYKSEHRFDNSGYRVSQPTYTKWELNPYMEYGLWDHTTIGANLFLQRANDSTDTNYGLGDSELFFRTRVWHNDYAVISMQPMVKIPGLYERRNSPKIGSEDVDVGISALGGINFNWIGYDQYAEVELGQRTRFGTPENQYIANATVGTNITKQIQILAQVFNTFRGDDPTIATFTQSPQDDYDLSKVQLSGVYHYDERLSFQLGGFYHVAGTNVGNGAGALFSIWTRF